MYALDVDEVPAPEVSGDPDQVPAPAQLYGVQVEGLVVYARFGGDDHPPAVEAPVADGDLEEAVVLDGFVVLVREREPGGERLVSEEGPDGGKRIGQRTRALLQPRREGTRRPHAEAHRGDVHVEVIPREAEVHVD